MLSRVRVAPHVDAARTMSDLLAVAVEGGAYAIAHAPSPAIGAAAAWVVGDVPDAQFGTTHALEVQRDARYVEREANLTALLVMRNCGQATPSVRTRTADVGLNTSVHFFVF